MVDLATRAMLGEKLEDMGYGTGLYPVPPYVAVKVPVFSFEKLTDVDVQLGPEMKSTGEVLGLGKTLEEALYKGMIGAGYQMQRAGGVLLTVCDTDKHEIAPLARKFADLGFTLYATAGTAQVLAQAGLEAQVVSKIHEAEENTATLLESGQISYIVSTSSKGRLPWLDSVKIRRKAVELGIPCLTAIDTANALADSLRSRYNEHSTELVDINHMRQKRKPLRFTKMQGAGNDYIYFSCFDQQIQSPESLAVYLSDRRYGVGGDGIILIEPSAVADARMRIFNLDGSEGKMCGNGIRCVGKFLYEKGIVPKQDMTVETLSGIRSLHLYVQHGQVTSVTVDMGKALRAPESIPVRLTGLDVTGRRVAVAGGEYEITCVGMGNPHCVVFCDNLDNLPIEQVGPQFEHDPLFPEGVNTEFVRVLDRTTIQMRVWERGSGETFACGTGACAAAVASVLRGYCLKNTDITVKLLGGELMIRYTDEAVYMTGKAETVFEGVIEV